MTGGWQALSRGLGGWPDDKFLIRIWVAHTSVLRVGPLTLLFSCPTRFCENRSTYLRSRSIPNFPHSLQST